MRIFYSFILFFFGVCFAGRTQEYFPNSDKNLLIETTWRYAFTMHVESATILHQSDDDYRHYVLFRYDSTYQQFLNGVHLTGFWSIKGNDLDYSFRSIKNFRIIRLNRESLELEFSMPNSKGRYLYHFNRADNEDIPFVRGQYELPEVVIARKRKSEVLKEKTAIGAIFQKKKEKKALEKAEKEAPFIQIELVGGGYYGGIDPVLRDYIVIKNNGRMIKEFKSKNQDLVVTRKEIPRKELEAFVQWAEEQDFFSLQRQYDCQNYVCEKRKFDHPRPIPLRLSIAYGNNRKIVTISIWGRDKNGIKYVDYPPQIDNIVDAIQRMASRV